MVALTGGTIDVLGQFSVAGGEALLTGSYNIIKLKSSAHRQLSMRNDQAPFTDPRVRQAIALSLNRPQIVQALFKGFADVGNDSPFAPVFPSTNTSMPAARAGHRQGQVAARRGRAPLGLQHPAGHREHPGDPQLRPDRGRVRRGHRREDQPEGGRPVQVLRQVHVRQLGLAGRHDEPGRLRAPRRAERVPGAPLQTINAKTGTGAWNAAHFSNAQYDKLFAQYVAAVDLTTQKSIAGQIETLLLDQTPIIFAYFYNFLTATAQGVTGVYPTAVGHLFLYNAAKS